MKSVFGIDSPLLKWMEAFADLFYLNILTVLLCIPVFTAGAAFTALHSVCLKMVRQEESYITADYFKAFKSNFKQATAIWLLFLLAAAVFGLDAYVFSYSGVDFSFIVRGAVLVAAFLVVITGLYVFPMQAKFENTIRMTIKNAFKSSMIQFPKTFLMLALLAAEIMGIIKLPGYFAALIILFVFSFHAYISARLYNKFFLQLEERGGGQNVQEK